MAGKKYLEAAKLVDSSKTYNYAEAVTLAKKTNYTKFDASVETSFALNVDPRQADQNIRGAMVLPNGTGKTQKVLVITQGAKEQEATEAGADYVGGKELLDKIKGGWFDFDIIVATPDMMGELGKLGKLLGPKGLMPNPKTGTVTPNVANAINDIKKGKVEYRVDKQAIVHLSIGKVSFGATKLEDNAKAFFGSLAAQKPSSLKGAFVKTTAISTTMGPGIKVENQVN